MAAVRHHIVSAFLLERFSRDTKRGRLVAMLEKKTGKPTCVGPRDAGVRRHFYSIDIDDGRRDPGIEEALSKIESIAAPLVRGVEEGDFPVREHRLELAMFIAVCWLRTPAWREEMESLMEGTRERVADPAEATELLEALESDQALWATALYAGLRNGELRGLRIEDVDLEAGTISVQRSWDDVEGEIEPKSKAGTRVIPICEHLRVRLEEHLAGLGWDSGLVFGETASVPYHYGKTTRRAYKAWADAKLGRITLHNARHSFRSYLDAIPVISDTRADRYLGHADGSMRARYSHAFQTQLASDAAALDEYLEGASAGKIVPLAATG